MITSNTVIIVGAGASKPYGLPIGYELRDAVLRMLLENGKKRAQLEDMYENKRVNNFFQQLSTSGYASIDSFLENRQEWIEIGKTAMALCLLDVESLCAKNLFPPYQPKDHWLEVLWSKMRSQNWSDVTNNISFITFNYDRYIEHYMYTVMRNNFPGEKIRIPPIFHVHGDLGPYNEKTYCILPLASDIVNTSTRISIVCEKCRVVNRSIIDRIIRDAAVIVFVGFGYAQSNMIKLGFSDIQGQNKHAMAKKIVVGTHHNIKMPEWGRVCAAYGLSPYAYQSGSGSISELVSRYIYSK